MTSNIISQEDIINELKENSIFISKRQLRYWRLTGELEPLRKNGNEFGYPVSYINRISEIAISKGYSKLEKITSIIIEDTYFDVYSITITKSGKYYNYIYYTNKGLVINKRNDFIETFI